MWKSSYNLLDKYGQTVNEPFQAINNSLVPVEIEWIPLGGSQRSFREKHRKRV